MSYLDFNFYSLVIPLLIIGLGLGTMIYYHFQRSVNYLQIYAIALIFLGLSIFLHTSLSPASVIAWMPLIHGLYYIACALHTYSIYQRLQIPTHQRRLFILCGFGVLGSTLLSWWYNDQTLRLIWLGGITTAIYLHRPVMFVLYRSKLIIDQQIKWLTIIIAVIAFIRAILLSFIVDQSYLISAYDIIWGSTQLFLILIDLIFWGLFIRSSMMEVIEKLHHERDIDPLTGLLNRRAFYEHLNELTPPRQNFSHAVLIADLDHFKHINDRYGHQVGDLALKHVSTIFQENIRKNDCLVRLGGEEFLILLHDTAPLVALNIAERLRLELKSRALVTDEHTIPMTVSIGVSFFNEASQFEDALYHADQFLYQAKAQGRDRVMSSEQYPIS